jgi:hypothetical protein
LAIAARRSDLSSLVMAFADYEFIKCDEGVVIARFEID